MSRIVATFEPAAVADAAPIAMLSRDLVEGGLGWSWRPGRVLRALRCPETMVLAARVHGRLAGAAVMHFGIDEARLNLLVVSPAWQRKGVGRALVHWLEASAITAGIGVVYLEVRARRPGACAFYRCLGYRVVQRLPDYYRGIETALVMASDLTSRQHPDTF